MFDNTRVTVDYDGYVIRVTSHGIGIAKNKDAEEPEFWLPRTFVGEIEYEKGGDSMLRLFGKIRSLQVAGWLARKEGLV